MVSFIQSNFKGFGSWYCNPGDRNFSAKPWVWFSSFNQGHGKLPCRRKKTFHTIIPGFLMKDGQPVGPFGVMGGAMQPQGHVQSNGQPDEPKYESPISALICLDGCGKKERKSLLNMGFPYHIVNCIARDGT